MNMLMKRENRKNVVILGSGFGGVYVYRRLFKYLGRSIRYTIVSPENHFLFTPLLHEVATGSLDSHSIVEPIRTITDYESTKVLQGEAGQINTSKKTLMVGSNEVHYDYLVVATGAKTCSYAISGVEENAYVLKTLGDGEHLKNRFISIFQEAAETKNIEAKREMLSFVIVGGGATGVEMAAEMAELCFGTFLELYGGEGISYEDIKVTLISSSTDLIPYFKRKVRKFAHKSLTKSGVDVMLGKMVSKVDEHGVVLSTGERIWSRTVLWTAGVLPNTPDFENKQDFAYDNGKVKVDKTLRIVGETDVFAIGDVSGAQDEKGSFYPNLAQVAVKEARHVAKEISNMEKGEKERREFSLKLKGELISLGQWHAAGDVFGFAIVGPLAWFIWRTVYLFKFISKSKKFKIALDWTINVFYPRDITKISKTSHKWSQNVKPHKH